MEANHVRAIIESWWSRCPRSGARSAIPPNRCSRSEQSYLSRDAFEAAGRAVQLVLVPGAQHGFTAAEDALVQPDVDRFLTAVLR